MTIYLQRSAPIQPRTSLGKSLAVVATMAAADAAEDQVFVRAERTQ